MAASAWVNITCYWWLCGCHSQYQLLSVPMLQPQSVSLVVSACSAASVNITFYQWLCCCLGQYHMLSVPMLQPQSVLIVHHDCTTASVILIARCHYTTASVNINCYLWLFYSLGQYHLLSVPIAVCDYTTASGQYHLLSVPALQPQSILIAAGDCHIIFNDSLVKKCILLICLSYYMLHVVLKCI